MKHQYIVVQTDEGDEVVAIGGIMQEARMYDYNGVEVDQTTLEVDHIDHTDFPDYADAEFSSAFNVDGVELDALELESLTHSYPNVLQDICIDARNG